MDGVALVTLQQYYPNNTWNKILLKLRNYVSNVKGY